MFWAKSEGNTDKASKTRLQILPIRTFKHRTRNLVLRGLHRNQSKPRRIRRSIHQISKRDVIDAVSAIKQRGAPVAANKALKSIKTFLRWCVGRAVLDRSPADGVPLPAREVARDRVLNDDELARVIAAARQIGGPYGGIVELLALTGQRREEVARCTWDEIDMSSRRTWKLASARTKNAKAHEVYLSDQAVAVLGRVDKTGALVFSQ